MKSVVAGNVNHYHFTHMPTTTADAGPHTLTRVRVALGTFVAIEAQARAALPPGMP